MGNRARLLENLPQQIRSPHHMQVINAVSFEHGAHFGNAIRLVLQAVQASVGIDHKVLVAFAAVGCGVDDLAARFSHIGRGEGVTLLQHAIVYVDVMALDVFVLA